MDYDPFPPKIHSYRELTRAEREVMREEWRQKYAERERRAGALRRFWEALKREWK